MGGVAVVMVSIQDLGTKGGYCYVPETKKDWPHCSVDNCKRSPQYEFYPTKAKIAASWYYICRVDLKAIIGALD